MDFCIAFMMIVERKDDRPHLGQGAIWRVFDNGHALNISSTNTRIDGE